MSREGAEPAASPALWTTEPISLHQLPLPSAAHTRGRDLGRVCSVGRCNPKCPSEHTSWDSGEHLMKHLDLKAIIHCSYLCTHINICTTMPRAFSQRSWELILAVCCASRGRPGGQSGGPRSSPRPPHPPASDLDTWWMVLSILQSAPCGIGAWLFPAFPVGSTWPGMWSASVTVCGW